MQETTTRNATDLDGIAVTEEAIDAALSAALREQGMPPHASPWHRADVVPAGRPADVMRAALEAALPHITAAERERLARVPIDRWGHTIADYTSPDHDPEDRSPKPRSYGRSAHRSGRRTRWRAPRKFPTSDHARRSLHAMPASKNVAPEQIAQWLLDELERKRNLYQFDAVREIEKRFGPEFTYTNDNGNPVIDRRVLKAFRSLTGDAVVWDRWDFSWRKRTPADKPSRKQE